MYVCLEAPVTIQPGETAFLPTGLAIAVPEGYAGLVFAARGGMARTSRGWPQPTKLGSSMQTTGARWQVALHNHGSQPQTVCDGDRVAQLLVVPVLAPSLEVVEELDETVRGAGGFGSTGKN
ncbi:MAG: dUTP diphosphatase [Oscillospiraceae bacterium]